MAGASTVSFLGTNYGLQVGHNYGSINAQFHLSPGKPDLSFTSSSI